MLAQLLLTRMNYLSQIISRTPIKRRLYVLGLAHFVLAALAGAISALSLISAIAFSASMSGLTGGNLVDAFSFYRSLGAGTSLAGLALSGLTAAAGWNLIHQRRDRLGRVLEMATLLLFPFGTVLGIATLIVLAKRPVHEHSDIACHPANAQ